jgi:hypothetical protein
MVARLTGSTVSILLMRCFAPSERVEGISYRPTADQRGHSSVGVDLLSIRRNNIGIWSSSKGSLPHSRTYMITPADQTSISGPEYSLQSTDVHLLMMSNNILATDDLWSRVIRTSTGCLEKVTIRHKVTQSEISNLDITSRRVTRV